LETKDLDTSEFCLVPAEISRQARFSKHPENVLLISFLIATFKLSANGSLQCLWSHGHLA